MISSLTGYGSADVSDGDFRYLVEMRSVNNRFLDISLRVPRRLSAYENEFRNWLREKLERGKVFVQISEPRETIRNSRFDFDADAAGRIVESFRKLGSVMDLEDDLKLSDIVSISDWFEPDEDEQRTEKQFELALKGLDEALRDFEKMRREEGENLDVDFRQRLKRLAKLAEDIAANAEVNRDLQLKKLHKRLERYLPEDKLDAGRLEQEAAIQIDRIDITEEIVRMRSHIQLFSETLDRDSGVGKRLAFILQEMNREMNTIGSKAASAEITSAVVEAKEELEKMREQVQNVT